MARTVRNPLLTLLELQQQGKRRGGIVQGTSTFQPAASGGGGGGGGLDLKKAISDIKKVSKDPGSLATPEGPLPQFLGGLLQDVPATLRGDLDPKDALTNLFKNTADFATGPLDLGTEIFGAPVQGGVSGDVFGAAQRLGGEAAAEAAVSAATEGGAGLAAAEGAGAAEAAAAAAEAAAATEAAAAAGTAAGGAAAGGTAAAAPAAAASSTSFLQALLSLLSSI